jgi:hypothetical protein
VKIKIKFSFKCAFWCFYYDYTRIKMHDANKFTHTNILYRIRTPVINKFLFATIQYAALYKHRCISPRMVEYCHTLSLNSLKKESHFKWCNFSEMPSRAVKFVTFIPSCLFIHRPGHQPPQVSISLLSSVTPQ